MGPSGSEDSSVDVLFDTPLARLAMRTGISVQPEHTPIPPTAFARAPATPATSVPWW